MTGARRARQGCLRQSHDSVASTELGSLASRRYRPPALRIVVARQLVLTYRPSLWRAVMHGDCSRLRSPGDVHRVDGVVYNDRTRRGDPVKAILKASDNV